MIRDDQRFAEDAAVAFAMYCDTNGLSEDEGTALAETLANVLYVTAEDRSGYLPPELLSLDSL